MRVNVYVKLEHHVYVGSHVAEVRVIEYEETAKPSPLSVVDGWIELTDIEVEELGKDRKEDS